MENKPAVDLNWLCNWLEENSSGIYRPAREAAHVIRGMSSEIESLRAQLKAAQEPAIRIENGRVVDFNPNYEGDVNNGEFYAAPMPAQQSPAVAVPDMLNKVILEQPDETKELVIGVDDNDCPYFIIGAQKFRLDPTVIENREDAKWYQKQLSIAFEKFTANANIQPSPRITEQDAYDIILDFYWFMENFKNKNGKNPSVIEWRDAQGRALLDKLNGKME